MSSTAPTDEAFARASRLLAARHLHQSIHLPPSPPHSPSRRRVTYSTTSNFSDTSLPAILFCGPMFGTRYINCQFESEARTAGVRVIAIDRPGFGGSDAVGVDGRVQAWLEAVPALLSELEVASVALVSHSAGTTFCSNTLSRLRGILERESPYVAFIAPWVEHAQSHHKLLSAAAQLPDGVLDYWAGVTQFVNEKIMPASAYSSGILSTLSANVFGSPAPAPSTTATTATAEPDTAAATPESARSTYGLDKATATWLDKLHAQYVYAEGMRGGNDEARLCLKKTGDGAWGDCGDYMKFVRALAQAERARISSPSSPPPAAPPPPPSSGEVGGGDGTAAAAAATATAPQQALLRVRVHFAGSDFMIGELGREYFERCWAQDGVSDAVDVAVREWPDADHDSVLTDHVHGAIPSVFAEIASLARSRTA